MVEVTKKDTESLASLLRRFNRKVQQSGILVEARKIRFFRPSKSKEQIKESAIRRSEIVRQKEYLRKIGKLPVFGEQNSRYRS